MSTTHDLRRKYWEFVPQSNPDGRVSVIRTTDYGKGIVEGNYVIVGHSGWHARYRVLEVELNSGADLLYCEHAPRSLAEIATEAFEQQDGISQAKAIDIPAWVPPEFKLEYRHIAKRRGEEAAAHDVRQMKQEAGL